MSENVITAIRNASLREDWELVNELRQAQHFEVSMQIYEFSSNLAGDEYEAQGSEFVIPADAKLPAEIITLSFPEGFSGNFILMINTSDGVLINVIEPHGRWPLGRFKSGSAELRIHEDCPLDDLDFMASVVRSAFIMSLINQPRFVARSAGLSRQQRRAGHRGFGIAVDAWHRVSWDLSKETVAKVSADPTFHRMPLHYRRGHHRRAEAHFKGSYQRDRAIIPSERLGWWQWIEGKWVGHPAFGIKKAKYAPRLSPDKLKAKMVQPVSVAQQLTMEGPQ